MYKKQSKEQKKELSSDGAALTESTPQQTTPTFTVEKIYAKDVSFEAPDTPAVFNEQASPQLQMHMNQSVQRLGETAYEVMLRLTLTCSVGEQSIYLAEVKQAGMFAVAGFDAPILDSLLGSHCPSVLYPYARRLVSDLIRAGGFPPCYLQPVNFDALYTEGLRQRQAQDQAQQDGGDLAGAAGNA